MNANYGGGAHGHSTDSDNDDATTRADLGGKMDGQPGTIAELQKDITAKIEDGFMQRMAVAMEHAFGNFLNNSRGKFVAMMGEGTQRSVTENGDLGDTVTADLANKNVANVNTSNAGRETVRLTLLMLLLLMCHIQDRHTMLRRERGWLLTLWGVMTSTVLLPQPHVIHLMLLTS